MKHDEYVREFLKFYPTEKQWETRSHMAAYNAELLEAAIGTAAEAGEVLDVIKKHVFYGKELDREALVLEMGDCYNYLAKLAYIRGISLDEVRAKNIEKLKKRYPSGGYSPEEATKQVDKNG